MTSPCVYIETYGCAFNVADGEAIGGVLQSEGFALVDRSDQADVVILNTCTVKERTYLNFEKRCGALKAAARDGTGPVLVVAGCIPGACPQSELLAGLAALGPDTIHRVGEVVRAALAGRPVRIVRAARRRAARVRPCLPTRRRNPVVEILPIASGCLSACSFCQTRLARGRLQSFHPDDIVRRARRALDEGVSELWVTSQDTGAYGRDAGFSLVRLLDRLCALPGDFRVRLGMTSPIWVWKDLEATLAALAHPKMFRFLHVPAQSGSDAVLAAMKRGNTAAEFEAVGAAFRERFPEGTLMTDIIAGFPTETEADFEATLAMLERVRPVAVNRSKFSARPGTPAALLKPLPDEVVSRRSRRLAEVAHRLARDYHARLIGRRERVLTGEVKDNGTTLAHNDAYRPVVLPGRLETGRWLLARYVGAADYHLKGEVVEDDPCRRSHGDRPGAGFSLLSSLNPL